MKKQHFYRLSAILLFLCIFLGIIPRNALQANAAEVENTFPEEGKIYNITYTYNQGNILREGNLSMYIGLFLENGTQTTSYLDTNGKLSDRLKLWLRCAFSFEKTEDGYYQILPVCMPGRCLQLGVGFREEPSVAVGIYEGKPEQKWILTPVENGGYRICSATYPDDPLGMIGQNIYPTLNDEDTVFTFYFVESPISFPTTRVYVKAPEDWYPGIWVYQNQEDVEYSWSWEAVMEQGEDGWFSFPSPSGTECKIVNHVRKGVGEQHYEHDDIFDIVDTDFSTDKWVVIYDDPTAEYDLTYRVYDYNPDTELPKTESPVIYSAPEDGKTYTIQGIAESGGIHWYSMAPFVIDADGINHSLFDTVGLPRHFVNTSFTFEEVKDGVFKILPVSMPGWCLQVSKSVDLNGEPTVHAAIFENKPEQLWAIIPHEDGYYLSCMSAPDQVLGRHTAGVQPVPSVAKNAITFYFAETTVAFPDTRIYVKAPEGWRPGLWVTPENGNPLKWGGFAIMEKNEDGWYSYPAPWDSKCDCDIVNHAKTGVAAQSFNRDELFDLGDIDFSTDKWVVITDDPNVEGDLTYKIYDYNPDGESPKTADTVTLAVPVVALLTSATAMLRLLRRKKTV